MIQEQLACTKKQLEANVVISVLNLSALVLPLSVISILYYLMGPAKKPSFALASGCIALGVLAFQGLYSAQLARRIAPIGIEDTQCIQGSFVESRYANSSKYYILSKNDRIKISRPPQNLNLTQDENTTFYLYNKVIVASVGHKGPNQVVPFNAKQWLIRCTLVGALGALAVFFPV